MFRLLNLMLLWVLATGGCSGHLAQKPQQTAVTIEHPQFVVTTVAPQDTFPSLARRYLQDAEKAWAITEYNGMASLTPGQQVVIPRVPINYGGMTPNGYQSVPVLAYSRLINAPSKSDAVPADIFEKHLAYLHENGYATVTLDQFYAFLSLKDSLPPKAVIISFDTTRRWVYEIAFPRLKALKMKATLFVRLKEIGTHNHLNWEQLSELSAAGFDIGLLGIDMDASDKKGKTSNVDGFEKQFTEPKATFKTRLNKECRYFAYPDGASDDLTIAMLKKHGYRAAFTRKRGSNPFFSDDYKINRSVIHKDFDSARFRQILITFTPAELK